MLHAQRVKFVAPLKRQSDRYLKTGALKCNVHVKKHVNFQPYRAYGAKYSRMNQVKFVEDSL